MPHSVTAKIVRFHQVGGPLRLEDLPQPPPGPGEVRLQVKAIGLNRVDTLFHKGEYFLPPIMPSRIGLESSGLVEAVGDGVDRAWIGKAVCSLPILDIATYGVAGEVALVPASTLVEMPEGVSFETAAASWMAYLTAYGAIVPAGIVRPGNAVLINAASSSVGLAALDIVRTLGGISIATTRSAEKRAALLDHGADHVIVTAEETLAERVAVITEGKGARLVLDSVAGPGLSELAKATALGGTVVVMGFLGTDKFGYADGKPTPYPFIDAVGRNLNIRGYVMPVAMADPAVFDAAKTFIADGLAEGRFHPKIDRTFALTDIEAAYAHLEANGQVGKIVVTP